MAAPAMTAYREEEVDNPELDDDVPGGHLTEYEKKIVFSPIRLVLIVGLAAFAIEMAVMVLIELLPEMHPLAEFLLDSTILTLCMSPILYKIVFRPLLHLIADYRAKEVELREYQEELEDKVEERTSDLDEAIDLLRQEIEMRRHVEQELRDSEERIRQIMAQAEDAILLIDPASHRIVDLNPTAERLFGRRRDELLSMTAGDLCGAGCAVQLTASLRYAQKPGDTCAIEQLPADLPAGNNSLISFRGKCVSLQGTALIYASFRDITRRVRLEKEARETQRRLFHVNRMTSLGVLVSSVAHEINNPNHCILLNAGMLQKSWPDILAALQERYAAGGDFQVGTTTFARAGQFLPGIVDGICDGAQQINGIVENLKNFIRDDRAGGTDSADITAAVRLCVAILSHHISRCTRFFTLELDEQLPRVRGNSRKLEQVIINLIMNALQSLPSPEKGVTVSSSIDDAGWVVVTVADEGCGIPPDVAARIFDPFFTTRQDAGGTGLGLSICADIVKEQGGYLDFRTELGRGTAFFLRLPTVEDNQNGATEIS
jgi:PAS domain S-box-containing protein